MSQRWKHSLSSQGSSLYSPLCPDIPPSPQSFSSSARLTGSSPAMARATFDFCHHTICSIQQLPLQLWHCFFTHMCLARQQATGWVARGWEMKEQSTYSLYKTQGTGWWSSYFNKRHLLMLLASTSEQDNHENVLWIHFSFKTIWGIMQESLSKMPLNGKHYICLSTASVCI